MKRRLFSLFLALTLVVGMLPAPAFAQETEPTQVTEAPTEAPATEAPATEAPATEAPATEAPAAEPTPAPTEALAPETTVAPAPTEAPTEPAPTEDEAVTAVQAMIDALPDVEDMSESYLDALEAAYSAFEALSEAQQAQINGVEKLEALFNWVNSQVSTLAAEETISGEVTWNNRTFTTPVKLTGDTTLTLVGDNKIECDAPLDLNNCKLTIKGTGTLTVIGNGRSEKWMLNGAIFDSTYNGYNTGGTLTLAGGTVKASGGKYNAISVRSMELRGGKLEAYGGSNAGIVCSYLYTYSGSLYATGSDCGIEMRTMYADNPGNLAILASNEKNASMAEMDAGDIGDIQDNAKKKTYYIGEVTGPMLSVKAQQGCLYEGVADQTATFSYSAKNLDGCMFGVEWTGDHLGLTAEFSLSVDQTIIVTTENTVKQGTYELKLIARDAENVNTLATKTFTVTVLGGPITITAQPKDASASCKGGDLDSWQGDKKIQVTATRAEGLTEDITYQWKLEDDTPLDGFTQSTIKLADLYTANKLTQQADKPWLLSAKVYCTLTYGRHSVNTNAVTLTVNTCAHENAKPDGNCQQCGEPCSSEPLLVREDGAYYAVDTSGIGDAEVGGGILTSGGTFYLTKDVLSRDMNAGNYTAGSENVILDLQDHTLNRLKMGNFPYGSFTVKNGTLGEIRTSASGKLILENILYQGKWFDDQFELTVQGENTRFERQVTFWGTTHLRGGHFEQGLDSDCAGRALELLEDGFAFYNSNGEVVDATDSARLVGREIHVAAHTCHYSDGKCDCGRSCPHSTVSDETGLCQKCGSQVYEANVTTADGSVTGYRTLEDALRNGADATVKLLADCVAEETDEAFYVKVPLTLDLNGKRMEGPSGLVVKKGPTTIQDNSPAKTGTIAGTRDSEFSGVGLWVYKDANVTLTILGGHIEGKTDGLRLVGQNTLILKGGSFSSIHFIEGAVATLRDSLAPGYAYYKDADNTLYDPGDRQEATVRLHVGAHPEHTPDSSGHCPCGYTAAAMLDTGAGKQYFADFGAALEAAKAASGSTLTLFRDVVLTNNIYIDSGTFTVDWHGHTLSGKMSSDLLLITDAAKVTLTDSVGTGGVHNTDGAAIGVYVRSQGSLTIRGGVYSPQLWKGERAYGSIQISGGEFRNPTDGGRYGGLYCDSGALADLLAPGYTFAYVDDDRRFNVYGVKMPDAYRSVYVVEHQHEFDEDGQCSCGYTCPHTEVDEAGECTLCGKRFYVQGTYDDGTTHYYGTISDALGDPAVTQAKILRALTEECESWNGGDRSVTLDLNGWNLVVESIQGGHLILRDNSGIGSILAVKEIQKDGQVSVESGRLAPQGETLSVYGKLTVTGGKVDSLTAMKGSTVSLSGGTFGKIVGSGVTLKELLAEDCYYAELGGETPKNYADSDTVIEGVSVVVCDHTSVLENKGTYFTTYTCNCGKVTYLLTVTVGESDKKYFGDYNTGFAYAAKSDGVVRFLELNGTIEVNAQGMVTIDMENRSYSAYGRSLVIKSGSTVKLVGQGAVMSKPETGGGSGSSGTREYGEFIPVTVESGGTFVLPANNLNGEPNMAKPTQLTVQSGGTAELQGGSTQRTDVYGTLKISGGSHWYIHQYEKGQLNITGGQIQLLQIYGDLPQNALSGGSYVTISVMEFRSGETEKFRDVTFADFQKMLVSGKVFQKKQDQSYPNEVEETPNYGTFNYKKELNKVNVTAAPFTGVQVVCQLGADTYEETVSTQYNVGEMDSSGNVVFRLGVNIQSQEAQPGVTVQWYQLGAEDSRTPVGTDLTCTLDPELPVGTHRFLAVVNCSGYVLESQPFAVTITPRVVNITGGFTAQDRDYELDNRSVQIIQGEVTFDKKAEEDDLSAQVHGGTIATPDAGQNRRVDYSVTLTGEDKDNYTLGSVPELTVTIRPIAQTLTFAETAVTKTYGDSPFVNALDHSAGDGQITYTSSDPAVATVGIDGTVTIRGAGEARITATAAATQNYVETATSFDLTVAKATGTVRNRNYSLGYLYGDDIPTPERKYFEASSTGAFRYSWSPAAPKNAGKYQLTVTVDEDGNYTSATLVLDVLVEKDVWARPTLVKAENETIGGKKDGKVTYTDTPALEYRPKRTRGEWIPVAVPAGEESVTVEGLAPGTYEFRRPGDENHFASSPETITIQPGPKLTVTLPDKQEGYTLTASKTQLGWHEDVTLTFRLDSVGAYKAADFGIWAEAGSEKTKLTLGNDGAVKLTAPEKDITITVTGVKTDNREPTASIQGRQLTENSLAYVKWESFQENPADDFVNGDFLITASDRGSGVASIWYYLSQTPLTLEELKEMNGAFWVRPTNQGKVSITEDGEYYLYVKALDKANNAGYACTGKLVKESNPPTFSGVKDGETYYVTQMLKIHDDGMPDWFKAAGSIGVVPNGGNKNPIEQRLDNYGRPYTITAGDRCGNEATITVYMKPLTDLTDRLYGILEESIQKSDRAALDEVEATLKGLDVTYAFDSEKKEINDALARIAQLRQVLDQVAAVEAQIDALPDSVEPYQQTVEDTQIKPARQAYSDLTDHQKTLVDSTKLDKLGKLEAQLDAWTITEGDGQTWYKGSGKSLSFTVNGQKRKFDGIRQGNTYIGSGVSSLLTASGEMDKPFTLTLKPEFLQCQTPGEHSFTVVYYSGLYSSGYLSISVTYTVETPANYLDVTDREEFEGKTTVTVDGKEYPIEEMAGYLQRIPTQRYVNLPETGDLLTIYSFKDGTPAGSYTNYPMGMQVFRITRQEGGAKAEEITEFANLLNYAGCSIRLTGTKGIRMITGIGENARTALTGAQGLAGYTLEEYGTVVMRGVGTPTLENSNSHNFAYKKGKADPVFARVGGMIQYTNVLVGFSLEDCKNTLTLRPYIKLKDTTTGETVTLYGGCVSRSIGYIAKQNENTYQPGTAGYKYVHEIIDAVYGKTEQGGETK